MKMRFGTNLKKLHWTTICWSIWITYWWWQTAINTGTMDYFFIAYLRAFHSLSDTVAELTLKFFVTLFDILGHVSSVCSTITQILPRSLYKLKQHLGCVRDRFHRFVVCRRCQHIYSMSHCIDQNQTSKTCSHRPFPHHPHSRQRRECGTLLLKLWS